MYLKPSRYEELNREVADLLETYGADDYPLDVFSLAGKMGIVLRPYSSIPLAKRAAFIDVSKDAFTIAPGKYEVDTTFICFDQNVNKGRQRQSLAHEIAHIWLEHPSDEEPFETEAEYFAAYLLAPIPLVLRLGLTSIWEVQEHFGVSSEAARIALERARNRCRCGKAGFEYEFEIIEMYNLKGGGSLAIA